MKRNTIQLGALLLAVLAVSLSFADARKRKSLEDILKNKPTAPKSEPKAKPEETPAKPSADKGKPAPETDRQSPRKPSQRDDETVRRILRDKPAVPVTRPKGYDPRANQKSNLKADRTLEFLRVGKISREKNSKWWVITFEPGKDGTVELPRRLLPNGLLESVEEVLKQNPTARFKILGENTTDGKKQYLLLRRVVIVPEEQESTEETKDNSATEKPKSESSDDSVVPSTDGQKSPGNTEKSEADAGKKGQPSASDIAKELLRNKPGKAVIAKPRPGRTKAENKKSVAPARELPATQAKRQIYSRTVRIHAVKGTKWYEIRFVSDNTLRDPPIRILPNTRLAKALKFMQKTGQMHREFIVSGEIAIYKSQRYILLRSVIKKRDMNQF